MTEDIVDMGKPKKTRTKAITRAELDEMFAKRDEEITKRIDEMCDSCSHHECECPHKIEELDQYTETRMDQLDKNDEILTDNINKLASQTNDAFIRMHKEVEQNTKGLEFAARTASETNQYIVDLSTKLDEEHRLRVASEEELAALRESVEAQSATMKRNSSDVMKLGVMAGACLGVALIVLAVFLAG